MAKRSFYLVVYDIRDDRRRVRLHNRLLAYGSPVQYSVFECLLTHEELRKMLRMIERTIRKREDHVRVYSLCEACVKKTRVYGEGREVLDDPVSIVV